MSSKKKTDSPLGDCKIKAVDAPFRSVSTPRSTKDLPVVGPVDGESDVATVEPLRIADCWTAEALSTRLRNELSPRGLNRLVRVASERGSSVEEFLRWALSEIV
jgi:hypothetical protein